MNGKKIRSYRKAGTGNVVFVYAVTGTADELAAFKKAQGENHVEDEKTKAPLYFTTRFAGDNVKLGIAQNTGKVFVDTSEMDAAASLVSQYGGNFGQELARASVAKIMGGSPISTPVSEKAPIDNL